jgi:hypothetical protein
MADTKHSGAGKHNRTSAPENPAVPSDWKIRLGLAWDEWGKSLMIPVGFVVIAVLVSAGFVPDNVVGVVTVAIVLLGLAGVSFYNLVIVSGASTLRKALVAVLLVAAVIAAGYPASAPIVDTDDIAEVDLAVEGESVTLPALSAGERWWLMEVEGKLKPGDAPSTTGYTLAVRNERKKELVKGSFKRTWGKMRVGYKSRGKKLVEHTRNIHHITADLGLPTQLALTQIDGGLSGPLKIFLRPEPVMLSTILWVDLPLLFLAGLADVVDNERKKARLIGPMAFILTFGSVFADNWVPGVWFGPLALSIMAGSLAWLLTNLLVGRILKPLFRSAHA